MIKVIKYVAPAVGGQSLQQETSAVANESSHLNAPADRKESLQMKSPAGVNESLQEYQVDVSGWENDTRFKRYNSDSRSYEQEDTEFNWVKEQDLYLERLFKEEQHEMDDLGLADLFDERGIDQEQLADYLHEKKKNKLYSIFLISPVRIAPIKRKISPSAVTPYLKMRRMSLQSTASPELQRNSALMLRDRANTISSPSTKKRNRKTAARRLVPGQRLITGIWGSNKKSGEEMVTNSTGLDRQLQEQFVAS